MSTALLASFRDFFETSLAQWSPGAKYAILKILDGGRTSASVSVVDIVSTKPRGLSGQFVLKIQSKADLWDEEIEYERHTNALNWSPIFGDKHIPKLVHHAEDDKYIAILYEIAGHSLSAVVTADSVEAGSLERYGRLVSRTLLTDLNRQYTVDLGASAKSTLESWLGYRLDPSQAASLHSFVERELATDGVAILAGRILANPLWFCTSDVARGMDGVQFSGIIHGDLHPGNIMVDRQSSPAEAFWLIDFALSRSAPLFYDHAYLELALLLNNLEGLGRERMIGLLDALDSGTSDGAAKVPVADVGLVQCPTSIRTGADEWQALYEKQRLDAYNAQQHLARIAAALNWTNKPIAIANKRLALAYGCWYTMRYLRFFCPLDWGALLLRAERSHQLSRSPDSSTIEKVFDLPLSWPALWSDCSRFDETTAAFVLITGAFDRTQDDPAALGLLPWAAIIDLDPNSDDGGLMSTAGSTLSTLRSTHQYGKTPLPLAVDHGTAWLMAGGWPSHLEQIPQSLSEWRRTYIRCIRDLFITLREATIPKPVTVIVLPGPGLEPDRISRILEIVDEELTDSGNILLIGDHAEDSSSLHVTHHAMTPSAFAFCVQTVFGAQAQTAEPTIPSATGLASIPIDRLRNWEEDLDVLHSRILIDLPSSAHNDEFWRGHPPTWTDLHAGADIPRSIQTKLVETLDDLLAQGRNRTLELHHLPGAGGTTTALRAVYSLRNSYPCAVLRRVSKLTVDRLDQMFQLTQRPVLLLAESADLSAAAREELYPDDSRNRGAADAGVWRKQFTGFRQSTGRIVKVD
jgi:serine/threonine protein kinase